MIKFVIFVVVESSVVFLPAKYKISLSIAAKNAVMDLFLNFISSR
jgi:hypothetical protein